MNQNDRELLGELAGQVHAALKVCACLVATHPRGSDLLRLIVGMPEHGGAEALGGKDSDVASRARDVQGNRRVAADYGSGNRRSRICE
jgi:hypothetical protein